MAFKKMNYIACVVLLLLLFPMTAMSAEFGDIRYPDRPLNLRIKRSPRSKWVGTLQVGQKVRIAYLKNGWAAVFEPNMTDEADVRIAGYANSKYLKKKPGKVQTEPWGELMHPVTVLNIREKRTPRSAKVGSLTPRNNVLVDFPEDGWYAVFEKGATIRSKLNALGFVKGDYLEPAPAPARETATEAEIVTEPVQTPAQSGSREVRSAVAPVPTAEKGPAASVAAPAESKQEVKSEHRDKAPEPWGEIVTIKHKVIVRKERSSKSNYVKTLSPGDRVKVDMLRNGWYAVFEAGETVRGEHRALGYVFKRQLEQGGQSAGKSATVQKATPATPSGPKKIVIKPDPFVSSRRPDPKADQHRHGISFKVLEEAETSRQGFDVVRLKIFVQVSSLPTPNVLEDFAATLWKEKRRKGKQMEILIYLPGMDLEDIAFAVARYSDTEPLEFWARRTALYGTDFMK